MTATLGSAVALDGPAPVRPRYGLMDVATVLPPSVDPHWMNGGTVRGYPQGLPFGWPGCSGGSSGDVKADGEGNDLPTFGPVTIILPVTCTAFDVRPGDDFRARALAVFEAREGWAVERELSQGEWQPLNPFLANADVVVLDATGVSPTEGLALLERAIGDTAQAGVIHADPATVTSWAAQYLVVKDGPILRTVIGTPVAVGGGYTGATPDGEAAAGATEGWAFASGTVVIRRDADEIIPGTFTESFDRHTNEVTAYAERTYLITWDRSVQAAVLIDRAA